MELELGRNGPALGRPSGMPPLSGNELKREATAEQTNAGGDPLLGGQPESKRVQRCAARRRPSTAAAAPAPHLRSLAIGGPAALAARHIGCDRSRENREKKLRFRDVR
jgi:hypothetical protein